MTGKLKQQPTCTDKKKTRKKTPASLGIISQVKTVDCRIWGGVHCLEILASQNAVTQTYEFSLECLCGIYVLFLSCAIRKPKNTVFLISQC